jgi:hypothetical protein
MAEPALAKRDRNRAPLLRLARNFFHPPVIDPLQPIDHTGQTDDCIRIPWGPFSALTVAVTVTRRVRPPLGTREFLDGMLHL